MYHDPCVEFILQTLTSNLKAEFTVLANQCRALRGPSPPPPPQQFWKTVKVLHQITQITLI
jgi:hypothetical protein